MSSQRSLSVPYNSLGTESMAHPSKVVPITTSMATGQIAFVEVELTRGFSMVELRSNFMTPVRLAIASTPLSARIIPANATQFLLNEAVERSRYSVVRWGALAMIIKSTTTTIGTAMAAAM